MAAKTKKRRRHVKRHHKKNPAAKHHTANKRRRVTRRRHKSNPGFHLTNTHHKKHRRRHRRNPEGAGSMDPMKFNNIIAMGGGMLSGAIGTPVIGSMLATSLNLTGNSKYLLQAGVGVGGYMVLKKFSPKFALSFLVASLAVTAYQASQDYGIISGLEDNARSLLGMTPSFNSIQRRRFNSFTNNLRAARRMHGLVPSGMSGIVPSMAGIVPHPETVQGYEGTTY